MKRIFLLLALIVLTVGCHAQIPANPNVPSCPVPNGTNYAALNQGNPASGLTFTETPAANTYCYTVQAVKTVSGVTYVSVASSVPPPVVVTGLTGAKTVTVNWQAPVSGPTPDGYVVSRASAVISVLGTPTPGTPTTADNVMPALPAADPIPGYDVALLAPTSLKVLSK